MARTNSRRVERAHPAGSPETLTLHDLVDALCESGADDREVVAVVARLLRTGRVRLAGRPGEARPTVE